MKEQGKHVAVTALTGCAAINLNIIEACTLHKILSITPKCTTIGDIFTERNVLEGKFAEKIEFLSSLDVLIIDEVSMLSPSLFELTYEIMNLHRFGNIRREVSDMNGLDFKKKSINATKIMKRYKKQLYDKDFKSNIQFILVGDFCQLPFVVTKSEPDYGKQLFDIILWERLNLYQIQLTTVVRQSDKTFQDFLHKVRNGQFTHDVQDFIKVCSKKQPDPNHHYVRLFTTNPPRNAYNEEQLEKLKTYERLYTATDNIMEWYKSTINDKILTQETLMPGELKLKVGAPVILLMNQKKGNKVNGSMGIVTCLEDDHVSVRFDDGEICEISAVTKNVEKLYYNEGCGRYISQTIASRSQIPLDIAYAMTVFKAQGQTLDRVIFHASPLHTTGLVYTALSRARTPEGLIIRDLKFSEMEKTTNPQVLSFLKSLSTPSEMKYENLWKLINEHSPTNIKQLKSLLNETYQDLERALTKKRNELSRQGLANDPLYDRLQRILVTRTQKVDESNPNKFFVHCPKCHQPYDSYYLLNIGLVCVCGVEIQDFCQAVTDKFGSITYIIQENSSSLVDPVKYVGVTESGQKRYDEHFRNWLENTNHSVKCSIFLNETTWIHMLKPTVNYQMYGNHVDSNRLRLNTRDPTIVNLSNVSDMYSKPTYSLCKIINKHDTPLIGDTGISFLGSIKEPSTLEDDSIFRYFNKYSTYDTYETVCLQIDKKICEHKIPCAALRRYNELLGRDEFEGFPRHLIKPKILDKTNNEKVVNDRPDLISWEIDNIIDLATHRQNEKSTESTKSKIRSTWSQGMLSQDLLRNPWKFYKMLHYHTPTRQKMICSVVHQILSLMSTEERKIFLSDEYMEIRYITRFCQRINTFTTDNDESKRYPQDV